MKNKLKPIVFIEGDRQFYRENKFAQNILLKALSDGITDINELRKLAGLKNAADVYRTLDKMAIRKEYHAALTRGGLDLDYLVNNIKSIIDSADTDGVKLKAVQTLLRSLGLYRYEKQEDTGKGWEEAVIEAIEKKGKPKEITEGEIVEGEFEEKKEVEEGEVKDYEVILPPMPEEEKKKHEEENKLGEELYEK